MKTKTKLKHKNKLKNKYKPVLHTATPPSATNKSLDMRITTHGSISAYVAHIAARMHDAASAARTLLVYAEGPAVPKLVTVVEIVKRRYPALTQ
ncbi:hypothetical protein GGI05_006071 [Coemansia sp. RSA 2603]|nr:hypothetical protein GGI05_006071 [Coemansia sp. RSA 2603]